MTGANRLCPVTSVPSPAGTVSIHDTARFGHPTEAHTETNTGFLLAG